MEHRDPPLSRRLLFVAVSSQPYDAPLGLARWIWNRGERDAGVLNRCVFGRLRSIPLTWPVLVPYLVWVLLIDKAPERGGRTFHFVRNARFFDWFVGYYPVS